MRSNTITIVFVAMAVIIAAILRIYHLSDVPNGLTWDEAALGYNTYSILKTGMDEHGVNFPLIFKSFGDYKPGAYIYWAGPFVSLFDLSVFSTRLPSAVAGVLTVMGVYLLSAKISNSRSVGIISAMVLAVSPWHIFYSRGAWEVNLFVTQLVFSLYFLVLFFEDEWPLWPHALLSLLTFYTYQAGKLLTPLLIFLTCWYYRDRFVLMARSKKFWRKEGVVVVIFLLLTIWTGVVNITGPNGNRLARLSIFNYQPGIEQKNIDIDGYQTAAIFHSQTEQTLRSIMSRYLYHFSPEVLFYEGSVITDRGHIPRMGMMYLVEAVFLLVGVVVATKRKMWLTIGWLLLSPIPASLTLAEFSTTRALFQVIPLVILVSFGLHSLLKYWVFWVLVPIYALNIIYGLDLFFFHSSKVWAFEFNYGHQQAVEIMKQYPSSNVVFTDIYGQPYIYYLFYSKYPPSEYQSQNRFEDGGIDVGHVSRIDKIEFRQFSIQDVKLSKNALFIGAPTNLPNELLLEADNIIYNQQIGIEPSKPIFRVVKTL